MVNGENDDPAPTEPVSAPTEAPQVAVTLGEASAATVLEAPPITAASAATVLEAPPITAASAAVVLEAPPTAAASAAVVLEAPPTATADGPYDASAAVPAIPQQRGPQMFPPYPPPPLYWPAPAQPSRRRRVLPALIAGAIALVLCVVLIAVVAARPGEQSARSSAHALKAKAAGTAPSATKGVPTTGDRIMETLTAQSRALVAGDHDGYLAPVGAGLQDGFNRRFGSLRAMGVQSWTPTLVDKPSQDADGNWAVLVRFDYCFGAGCTQLFPQVVQTSWTLTADKASISRYEQSTEPWDASALQALTGRRVIVAGSAANASKLQRVLTKADQAADIADRYAHWGPAPKWYIVYIAGEGEWKTWWDNGDIGASYDGYSTGPRGIVMQAGDAGQSWLPSLLSHEFGHVVSVGEEYGSAATWWLTEGLADYISDRDGTTLRGRLTDVRRYIKRGRWDGAVTLGPPGENASAEDIDARYGIALISVTCLAKKFGEGKMLDFFGAVVRQRQPLETASAQVLGTDWAGVASYCAGQVRAA